jgi:hypothetical protein
MPGGKDKPAGMSGKRGGATKAAKKKATKKR